MNKFELFIKAEICPSKEVCKNMINEIQAADHIKEIFYR